MSSTWLIQASKEHDIHEREFSFFIFKGRNKRTIEWFKFYGRNYNEINKKRTLTDISTIIITRVFTGNKEKDRAY